MIEESRRGPYRVSTDPARLDVDAIHRLLSASYWDAERSKPVVAKSLKHSFCFGLYRGAELVGFARVVTDYTTYAYLCDVIVDESCRGKGLGKWLVERVMASPRLETVKSWFLRTTDAHGLYRQFGFTEVTDPEKLMQRKPRP